MAQRSWDPRSMFFVGSTEVEFDPTAVVLGPGQTLEGYTDWYTDHAEAILRMRRTWALTRASKTPFLRSSILWPSLQTQYGKLNLHTDIRHPDMTEPFRHCCNSLLCPYCADVAGLYFYDLLNPETGLNEHTGALERLIMRRRWDMVRNLRRQRAYVARAGRGTFVVATIMAYYYDDRSGWMIRITLVCVRHRRSRRQRFTHRTSRRTVGS